MSKKVIVIGGGAAGMMAAGVAAKKGLEVHLFEKNDKLGKKVFITGKGRCNFTNASDVESILEHVVRNPNFLYSALYTFTNQDLIQFFNDLSVPTKVERGNRVFPKSDKSNDIIKALTKFLSTHQVKIHYYSNVKKILVNDGRVTGIQLDSGERHFCDRIIITTGGLSYPKTGSTGHGLTMVEDLGHNIISPFPSLVPIEIKENWIKELQGLSLKNIEMSLYKNNKLIKSEFGEMIFTHYGISGPVTLTLSAYMEGSYTEHTIHINLKPALSYEQLDRRIQKDFEKYSRRQFKNSLDDLFPKKLIPIMILLSNISPEKYVNQITKFERRSLVSLTQKLILSVKKLRPIDEAIVTAGGVDINEINPSTMESKIVQGLYFGGEIMNVDALTGGYNLQIAFSTGYLAGYNC